MVKLKIIFFLSAVFAFYNATAQDSMFPSIIMNSKINSTDSNIYMNPAYQFHITSIDWDTKIVTIDKNVVLPDIQNMPNAQYWQMFVIGHDVATDVNYVLQLTSQLSPNSFTFTRVPPQQGSYTPNYIATAEIMNMGNNYSDLDQVNLINPNGDNRTYIMLHVTSDPYNVTIYDDGIGSDYVKGNFTVGQIYNTFYVPGNESTGDGALTVKVDSVYDNYNGDITNTIFVENAVVGFRNPQQAWVALSLKEICENPKTDVNHFCRYVNKHNNKFVALIPHNNGTTIHGFGITYSDDFITWDDVQQVTPIGTLTDWMDTALTKILPCIAQNNVTNGVHTIPFRQGKVLTPTINRIGIMTTSDFENYTYTSNYFTCADILDVSTTTWNNASYCYFNGVHYIFGDITISGVRRVHVFTWGGSTSDMSLTRIQVIGNNRTEICWNFLFSATPSPFIYNNKLYMFIEGNSGQDGGEQYGNRTDCNGLFIWNESTLLFDEYFSNPLIINVEVDGDYSPYHDHQDALSVYQYNSKLYVLIGFDEVTNTYKVIPCQLCMKDKETVDEWLKDTIQDNISKILTVTAMLQGNYNTETESMNQAKDVDVTGNVFNKWSGTIVDTLTVQIRSTKGPDYIIEKEFSASYVKTDGSIKLSDSLPSNISGYHYIVIKHWKSVETWSDSVDFTKPFVNYNFYTHTLSAQFADNMTNKINSTIINGNMIYAGDITNEGEEEGVQDGYVTLDDMFMVYDANLIVLSGYEVLDINGDGYVTLDDMFIIYDNNLVVAQVINPITLNSKKK